MSHGIRELYRLVIDQIDQTKFPDCRSKATRLLVFSGSGKMNRSSMNIFFETAWCTYISGQSLRALE